MVWDQRKQRAINRGRPIDWIVMRNRLRSLDAKNKRDIGRLLEQLSQRIGFRIAPGFTERVIFRELFPRGLTLLDLSRKDRRGIDLAHVARRGAPGGARAGGHPGPQGRARCLSTTSIVSTRCGVDVTGKLGSCRSPIRCGTTCATTGDVDARQGLKNAQAAA